VEPSTKQTLKQKKETKYIQNQPSRFDMIKKSLSDANLISKLENKVTDTNFRIEKVQHKLE